jgi:RsmE family RNA methyltransferase
LFHRLIHVLRFELETEFVLFSENYFNLCVVKKIEKKNIICFVLKKNLIHKNPQKIVAYVPLLDREYLNITLFHCGQQQVDEIFFVRTDLSHKKKYEINDFAKFKKIIVAGCEQARQYTIPIIHETIYSFSEINFNNFYFFSEKGEQTIQTISYTPLKTIHFFCGPEAGLTEKEESSLLQNNTVQSIKLGENTLRSCDVLSFASIFFRSLSC